MCGIVGVFNHEDAPYIALQALQQLQHRGEESCGISFFGDKGIITEKGLGLISHVFANGNSHILQGKMAIAHNRYSTVGSTGIKNAQPVSIECRHGAVSVVHNGTLTNIVDLKNTLNSAGSIFQTGTDTEIILHLFAKNDESDVFKNIRSVLTNIEGAFSLLILSPNQLIAVRDPSGFRPLVMGRLSDSYVFASETCALKFLGAKLVKELNPGEIIQLTLDEKTISENKEYLEAKEKTFCIFEFIYFARADSTFEGQSVCKIRQELGRQLAREDRYFKADLITSIPDSGNSYALGYSEESRIKMDYGLIRNRYSGRSFIKPSQKSREDSVLTKISPVEEIVSGKDVIAIDDSIVRGTTTALVVEMLRKAGAKSVHVRSGSPRIVGACHYGIDTPRRTNLIAAKNSDEEICKFIGADSLGYLSLEGMKKVFGETGYCDACFSKKYPICLKV